MPYTDHENEKWETLGKWDTPPAEYAPSYDPENVDVCRELGTSRSALEARAAQDVTDIQRSKKLTAKEDYVKLRAGGHTIRYCAQFLGIAKSTAQLWEAEAKERIANLQEAELLSVYNEYGLDRIGQIRRLGDELQAIEGVLEYRKTWGANFDEAAAYKTITEAVDMISANGYQQGTRTRTTKQAGGYWTIPTDRLIELKLKLIDRLQKLYIPIRDDAPQENFSAQNILWAITDYLEQLRTGQLKGREAQLEAEGLKMLLQAANLAQDKQEDQV